MKFATILFALLLVVACVHQEKTQPDTIQGSAGIGAGLVEGAGLGAGASLGVGVSPDHVTGED